LDKINDEIGLRYPVRFVNFLKNIRIWITFGRESTAPGSFGSDNDLDYDVALGRRKITEKIQAVKNSPES